MNTSNNRRHSRSFRRRGTRRHSTGRYDTSLQPEERIDGVEVLRPAHGGTCFAIDPATSTPMFVAHTLPGEIVTARVVTRRAKVIIADAVEVARASNERQPHIWPEAGPGGVGGADLGHVRPAAQRRWKHDVLVDQIRRVGGRALADHIGDTVGHDALMPRVASADDHSTTSDDSEEQLHWRTRADFTVSATGRLAMARQRSHELVDIDDMPLLDRSLLDLDVLGNSRWRRLWKPGQRVRLVAPNASGRRVLIGASAFNAHMRRVDDRATWEVRCGGKVEHFSVAASGFWQAHRCASSDLVTSVMEMCGLERGDSVIELYSGAGLFTRFLANRVGHPGAVVSVEGAEQAVADARINLAHRPNVIAAHAAVTPSTIMQAWSDLEDRPDLVVLDPPRSGAGADVIGAIVRTGATRVILVSCDAAAGVRDMSALVAAGYRVEDVRVLDLFPHTHHVETVCLMTRVR